MTINSFTFETIAEPRFYEFPENHRCLVVHNGRGSNEQLVRYRRGSRAYTTHGTDVGKTTDYLFVQAIDIPPGYDHAAPLPANLSDGEELRVYKITEDREAFWSGDAVWIIDKETRYPRHTLVSGAAIYPVVAATNTRAVRVSHSF